MGDFIGYRCSICAAEYTPNQVTYTCPRDGGNLDIVFDYKDLSRRFVPEDIFSRTDYSLWRYLPLLPVSDPGHEATTLRKVGWTPLYQPPLVLKETGMETLWIKDESTNPTASFKDRASAVVAVRAQQIQAPVVVTASTGNAGAALAGMSAAIGQRAVIFAPRTAPPAKIAQLLVYGARVILVEGNYDQAFDLSVQAAEEFGWYCRNTGYNPFTAEGKKTAALEIWEHLLSRASHGRKSLAVFVSVGDGNIISGLHKGFKDLNSLGWMEQMPRLFGVQSEGSAAVATAFFSESERIYPVRAQTIADSISVDLPRDGLRAVRAATQTGGAYVTVKDEEILRAIAGLGKSGIFAEPAGAAAYAGFKKALHLGIIHPQDAVVVINTGSGLKDTSAATQAVPKAPIIEPTLAALQKHLSRSG